MSTTKKKTVDKLDLPKLIASGRMARVDAAKCTRRMSGHSTCSVRPNTN